MIARPAIIDTNVIVAGMLTGDSGSPTARILDGMLSGAFPFVISVALLDEYRRVLLRDRVRQRHGLSSDQIDAVLTGVAANAIVRDPEPSSTSAPDPGDQHLWDLLALVPDAFLVTGDRRLHEDAPAARASVLTARAFLETLLG